LDERAEGGVIEHRRKRHLALVMEDRPAAWLGSRLGLRLGLRLG
jgi:hypothetical protein